MSAITVQDVAETGSWPAFVALSQARQSHDTLAQLKEASRALSLDPALSRAEEIVTTVGTALVSDADCSEACAAIIAALAPMAALDAILRIRRLAHDQALTLANREDDT